MRGSRFLPCDLFQIDLEPEQKSKINLLKIRFYVYCLVHCGNGISGHPLSKICPEFS
jgi:hypothetical protein